MSENTLTNSVHTESLIFLIIFNQIQLTEKLKLSFWEFHVVNEETGVVHNLMIIRSVLNTEYIDTFQMLSFHCILSFKEIKS